MVYNGHRTSHSKWNQNYKLIKLTKLKMTVDWWQLMISPLWIQVRFIEILSITKVITDNGWHFTQTIIFVAWVCVSNFILLEIYFISEIFSFSTMIIIIMIHKHPFNSIGQDTMDASVLLNIVNHMWLHATKTRILPQKNGSHKKFTI